MLGWGGDRRGGRGVSLMPALTSASILSVNRQKGGAGEKVLLLTVGSAPVIKKIGHPGFAEQRVDL